MILLPDGTGAGASADWVAVGSATRHECLEDDNGSTSYVRCSVLNSQMIIEFANPSVVESKIASIDSVSFQSSGKSIHRTNPSVVVISYEVPSGNVSQTCSYDAHRTNYETIIGTPKVYSDGPGATAWTYSDLESLEMKCTKGIGVGLGHGVNLSYLALIVTYTEAEAADNATFFGANF
jgi:hypothetical protein